jgi:iron complex outermembrane receptor protein
VIATTQPSAQAQRGETLEGIKVTAPRLERNALDTPAAVTVVEEQSIQRGRQRRSLDESLGTVPGLFFQNRYNFAQGLRISSRGFGARAPFGVRGLHIRLDGLPLTLPDGQSQLDTIDLDSAQRIEVRRGPASVLYGNATGGVIDITTADGTDMRHNALIRADTGSYEYNRINARVGGSSEDWAHNVSVTRLDFGGFRDQSRVKRTRLNAKVRHELGDGHSLTGIATLLDAPVGEDPGGLTARQVASDRSQATRFARRLDAGQEVTQQRLGMVYEGDVGTGELTARAHYTRRDFEQQLPFPGSSLIGFERDFFGAGITYEDELAGAGPGREPVRFVIGADWDRQIDDRERFIVDPQGRVVRQTEREEQRATAFGMFAQADIPLGAAWTATLGVRGDRTRLTIDDQFAADGDQSGERTFDEPSYLAGLSYRPSPNHQIYANLATAFETPTFTEFANPDGGGFNPDVEPQQALNREIGARGSWGGMLDYEVALFSVRVEDELVAFEASEGPETDRTFFENAGRTRRNGLELGLDWFIGDAWRLKTSYTYADYEFRVFNEDGQSLRGNQLPGIPRHEASAELLWEPSLDSYVGLATQVVDSVYVDNTNSAEAAGYALAHLRAGHTWRHDDGQITLYGRLRNLFDRAYPANVRININSDGFFEPAPGRHGFVGLEIGF